MQITAKFPGRCAKCGGSIAAGTVIEWSKSGGSSHVSCPAGGAKVAAAPAQPRRAGAYQGRRGKACITGGNCSSFGSGRSCGGHDCDGY